MNPKQWIDANGEIGVIKRADGVVMGYYNTPWGDIRVAESDGDWNRLMWAKFLDPYILADNAFTPTFLDARVIYDVNGVATSTPLNTFRYADRTSAQWIANKYGNGILVEAPYMEKATGLTFDPPSVWNFMTLDGRSINAGDVAVYYTRNPRRTAETLIRQYFGV